MSGPSLIEWTDATWNPVTGCSKISAGCKHCYAERLSFRLRAMGKPQYTNGFELTLQPEALDTPRTWTRPRMIFVNSMSDLFHEEVGLDYASRVFAVMNECPQHTFQVLTKRPEIALAQSPYLTWSSNIWMGTSVEDSRVVHRIDALRRIPARTRFLSLEPLLGPLPKLNLSGVDWAIVGGESGPRARPMSKEWVTDLRDQCARANVPFFFKQWGGVNKKKTGRELDGKTWDQMPSVLPVGGVRDRHASDDLDGRPAHSRKAQNTRRISERVDANPGHSAKGGVVHRRVRWTG